MVVKSKFQDPDVTVSYFSIYRYGTCLEITATVVGVFLGLLSGCGVCYNLVQVGELATSFVDRTAFPDRLSSYLPLTQAFGGGRRLINASHEENMKALIEDAEAMAIGMFLSIAIAIILNVLSVALIGWSALKQITRIRMLFLRCVLRQDMTWFDTDNEFNLASSMSENLVKLKEGMGEKLGVVANLVGTAILCVCTSFPLGWELTTACLSVMPFSLAASIVLSNYQTKSSIREMESYSQAGKQAEEILKSVKTVVSFAGESKESDRYRTLLIPAENYGRKRGVYTGLGNGFNWILTYSLNAIGLAYGARLILDDFYKPAEERRYTFGIMFSILTTAYMATQSITLCVPHAEVFASARAAAASIFQLIDREPKIDSLQESGLSPRSVKGEISLEDIHFVYPSRPDIKVLKGFCLHVKPGENVALVGSSGCGKSTIIQLLQRLYDPLAGSIKLDGKELKALNLSWLRSSLGVVGQEPVLFRGTIHDNISIGCPDATREEVQRVAEMAYAHDFISHLANGYDTMIGERGASLSGGQKQRIAIARSLLREPAVLLLDEATSALDPHSERQVQAALDRASQGRTTITVSHRLSTIVNADRIVCMDQGSIVEQGTHEELMKNKGFYYNLVTRGNEGNDTEESKPLIEDNVPDDQDGVVLLPGRNDVKRRSTKRMQRQISKRESRDWMTPRGSLSSVVSTGIQNYIYNSDNTLAEESEEDAKDDEEVKPITTYELMQLNGPEWLSITIGAIAAFIQGCCFPAFAILFGYTSGIFVLADHDMLVHLADMFSGLFILVAAIAGISMCLQSITFTSAGLKMTTRLRYLYFSALLKQEMAFYDKESNTVGAVCARLTGDPAEIQGATGLTIGLIIQGISSVLVGFFIAISYNWKLTLVSAAFLPLMVGSIWLEGIISQKSQSDERVAMEDATSIATEAIVSIKTVQSLGIEKLFLKKFEKSLTSACVAVAKKTRLRGLVLGLGVYVPFISYCSATVYGAVLVANGELEYKTVMLITEAVMYGAYMLGQSLVYAPGFNSAKASGARILHIIRREPKVQTEDKVKDKIDWTATGKFSVNNVEFSYPTRPHQRILRGINLKVDAGKTVALVGSSGCGKSTILQLLQRFYDPDSGNIILGTFSTRHLGLKMNDEPTFRPLEGSAKRKEREMWVCEEHLISARIPPQFRDYCAHALLDYQELDGHDIRTGMRLPRLRRQLGVVQQEPVLFDRTLAENIAYGDNNRKVSMHEIVAAAKAANIHSFIVSLPKGYETNLGASGAQLSGGQKQRVCIARALIRSPRLLLLDEATSALDANSERVVAEALDKAAKGRTCITIAHRLSTIKDADVICVLDKGQIVEKGTHSELINLKGYYWKLSKGQNMS